jgi:tetratricopeptide (TPR) repeat protein
MPGQNRSLQIHENGSCLRRALWASLLVAASLGAKVFPAAAQQPSTPIPPSTTLSAPPSAAQQPQPSLSAARVDPREDAAYKSFYDIPPVHTDELIRQGEAFLAQYPNSIYRELVYSRLSQAYVVKQNLNRVEEDGEKALALNPNDADVLALLGWAIPHNYDAASPNAGARLQQAEDYSRRALQVLSSLPQPPSMTPEQFAQLKNDRLSQAHSGLGLVYFRRAQFAQAAPEFEQAVRLASSPDPVDYFLLGQSLLQLRQFNDAIAAFEGCGRNSNIFQARCQDSAAQARQLSAAQPGGQHSAAKP